MTERGLKSDGVVEMMIRRVEKEFFEGELDEGLKRREGKINPFIDRHMINFDIDTPLLLRPTLPGSSMSIFSSFGVLEPSPPESLSPLTMFNL